jgi:hypothetical protein
MNRGVHPCRTIFGAELGSERRGNGPDVLSTVIRFGRSCSVISQVY